jgi:hypothetical protein
MDLSKIAMASVPVVVGVILAGFIMYSLRDSFPALKKASGGFDTGFL